MNILALCTSFTSGSIAVSVNNKITFISYLDIIITHSERIMPQIDFGLKQSRIELDNIDLICLANGPGSFTGTRIGLATAKGLCYANQIPLLPVNTLELLSYNFYGCKYPILPFIDAKMGEVYAALYSPELKEIISPQNSKPDEFLKKIREPVIIIGDGISRYRDIIKQSGIKYETVLPHLNIPLASGLISISSKLKNIPEFDFDLIAELEPYYLRKSQAEIVKLEKEKDKKS